MLVRAWVEEFSPSRSVAGSDRVTRFTRLGPGGGKTLQGFVTQAILTGGYGGNTRLTEL